MGKERKEAWAKKTRKSKRAIYEMASGLNHKKNYICRPLNAKEKVHI